jgi:hypothetical protein
MDGQQIDQMARALARGMSRRKALKGVAVGLGLSAAGALRVPTAAARPEWDVCEYFCATGDVVRPTRCQKECRQEITVAGVACGFNQRLARFESKSACEASQD